MSLRHFIEHLMCIGGELEHPNALPSPARKNRALWSALLWRWGIYRQLICPGSSHEPGPMVVGQERGPLVPVRAWNRDKWVHTNRDQCPRGPGRPPGLTNRDECPHGSRFVTAWTNGLAMPEPKPCFLLVQREAYFML